MEFKKKKKSRPFFIIIFKPKSLVSRPEVFSPLILGILGGVVKECFLIRQEQIPIRNALALYFRVAMVKTFCTFFP